MSSIFEAIADVPDPPCTKVGRCRHYEKCAKQEMSCEAFHAYVSGGSGRKRRASKEPAKFWFDLTFQTKDAPVQVKNSRQVFV